jgi:hypothetical protein
MATLTTRKKNSDVDSITLFYEKNNAMAKHTIAYLLSIGVFEKPVATSPTPLELALEDVKAGRVTRIKNIDNFAKEILE